MPRIENEKQSEQYRHSMLVDVKLFASCRELIGKDKITLRFEKNQVTVGSLRKKILDSYPALSSQIQFVVAINCEVADEITPIRSADVVAILPPVSGG